MGRSNHRTSSYDHRDLSMYHRRPSSQVLRTQIVQISSTGSCFGANPGMPFVLAGARALVSPRPHAMISCGLVVVGWGTGGDYNMYAACKCDMRSKSNPMELESK